MIVLSKRTCCLVQPNAIPHYIIKMQSIRQLVIRSSSFVFATKVQRGALEAQGSVQASHLGSWEGLFQEPPEEGMPNCRNGFHGAVD